MRYVDWDLIIAAREGDLDLANKCIERGANPMLRDDQEWSALMNAAYYARNKLAKLLLPISDVQAYGKASFNALGYAKRHKSQYTANIIRAYKSANSCHSGLDIGEIWIPQSDLHHEFFMACMSDDIEAAKGCLQRGANPDFHGGYGDESALTVAAKKSSANMVKFLLSICDHEVVNNSGWTLLMLAAGRKNDEVARVLLPYSDLDRKNGSKKAALDIARESERQTIVEMIEAQLLVKKEQKELGILLERPVSKKSSLETGL
jgi:ankyrin repeat protein